MRILLVIAYCASLSAAELIRVSAGAQERMPVPGLTAAYSLDPDCAEAQVDSGFVVVLSGRRACATHVVAVTAEYGVSQIDVTVWARRIQWQTDKAARERARRIAESGSFSSFYSSNPAEFQSSIDLSRSEAGRSTRVTATLANGYGFSPLQRRTALPTASIQFDAGPNVFTLLDSRVEQSPLTLDDIVVRGLHVQNGAWFLHAGVVSLSGFRQSLVERSVDKTVSAGYRFKLTPHSGVTSNLQWISASSQYVAGRSGVIGSVVYDYEQPERLRLQAEIGAAPRPGGSALLEFDGTTDRLRLAVRATPARFPGLSTGRSRGTQAVGSWTRRLTETLGLDVSGSHDTYALLDGTSQSNASGTARIEWRIAKPVSVSGGLSGAQFSRRNDPSVNSISTPVAVSLDTRWIGNTVQYQFGRNRGSELGSHSIRETLRMSLRSLTLNLTGTRQTQAPTVGFLLSGMPWLRQALLTSGIAAQTPEQIQDFVRDHADLIAGGYVRNLDINVSPLRRQVGGIANWTAPRRFMSVRAEWRWDDDQRVTGRSTSVTKDLRLSVRLNRQTDLLLAGSLFESRIAQIGLIRVSVLSIGLSTRFVNVPDILRPSRGHLQGVVFLDAAGLGRYEASLTGIAGAVVVLDGVRRTRTNASGRYAFSYVPAGAHSLEVIVASGDPHVFTTPPHVDTDENATVNFGIGRRKAIIFGDVKNDAGKPLGNIMVHIAGSSSRDLRTSSAGQFSANDLDAGQYTVTIDPDSLPPSYAVDKLEPRLVSTQAGEPVRADFNIRALRSISGQISCAGASLDTEKLTLRIESRPPPVAIDNEGRFRATDLQAGSLLLIATYRGAELRRIVDVPMDPATVSGVVINVCTSRRSAP